MLIIENTDTWGFDHAIRGMRNPLNSWDKSDTKWYSNTSFILGDNDEALMKSLIKAGSSHRKFLRQIFVSMDVTAPMYWWSEMDTYKVGTVANSCSKMHTLHKRDLSLADFSTDKMNSRSRANLELIINLINDYRKRYCEYKLKDDWWQMIQLLPASYNQKRTVTLNYENLLNIYFQRRNHKLDEWHVFCDWIENLPYMDVFLTAAGDDE